MQLTTSEKILNAAEELFAQSNFDAVTVRQITNKADVKLALIHYHFGTKEEVFNAVIRRRINQLSQSRIQLLEHFLAQNRGAPLTLDEIVNAFVMPYLFWSLHGGDSWRSYARIVSTLLGYNLALLQEQFDYGAQLFLKELRRAVPEAQETNIQWGFDFMVGVMCNTFSEVDRIGGLSGGLCTIDNKEEACSYLLPFIVSGLKGMLVNQKTDISKNIELIRKISLTQ